MSTERAYNFLHWAAFGGRNPQPKEIGNFSTKKCLKSLDKLINNIKPYFWLETITGK